MIYNILLFFTGYYIFYKFIYLLLYVYDKLNNTVLDNNNTIQNSDTESLNEEKIYENKYLKEIRKLNKEWVFTEKENTLYEQVYKNVFDNFISNLNNKFNEINNEIMIIENESKMNIYDYIKKTYSNYCNEVLEENKLTYDNEEDYDEDNEEDNYSKLSIESFIMIKDKIIKQLIVLRENLITKINSETEINKCKEYSDKFAKKQIINQRLINLKNSFVMEMTPLGNVLMKYDNIKNEFIYYSDKTMSYRFLEVVCRKYIKMFNCRPLYIDMEEELKFCEDKLKNETQEKEDLNKSKQIKEKTNQYNYQGKIINFSFIQKPDKKIYNKKLKLTFSEFKNQKK